MRLAPKASANRVTGLKGGTDGTAALAVQVTAVPEGGKANAALIKLLAKAWKLPKTAVSVASGATDRNKVLFIEGDPETLLPRLQAWMEENHG